MMCSNLLLHGNSFMCLSLQQSNVKQAVLRSFVIVAVKTEKVFRQQESGVLRLLGDKAESTFSSPCG